MDVQLFVVKGVERHSGIPYERLHALKATKNSPEIAHLAGAGVQRVQVNARGDRVDVQGGFRRRQSSARHCTRHIPLLDPLSFLLRVCFLLEEEEKSQSSLIIYLVI